MILPSFTTEEINLCYRLMDVAADDVKLDVVASCLFRATAELLRVSYRERTIHDPWPGQTSISDQLGA